MKFEKDYFSGKTSCYSGGYKKADFLINARTNLILKYKQPAKEKKILDVGCAYGFFLQGVDKKFSCFGLDISKHAIRIAKKNTKAQLIVNSADINWPYKNRFFDIITMWDLIEHLNNPEKSIKEAKRCLKKGGYLFIQTPNKYIRNLIGDKDKTHINKKSISSWTKIFKKYGFQIIEKYTEFPRFVGKYDFINKFLKILGLPLGTNICLILKNETN